MGKQRRPRKPTSDVGGPPRGVGWGGGPPWTPTVGASICDAQRRRRRRLREGGWCVAARVALKLDGRRRFLGRRKHGRRRPRQHGPLVAFKPFGQLDPTGSAARGRTVAPDGQHELDDRATTAIGNSTQVEMQQRRQADVAERQQIAGDPVGCRRRRNRP